VKGRGALVVLGLAVVVVLLLVAIGAPDERTNRELDPGSTGPLGAKGVVLVLDELGADVEVTGGGLDDDVDTALLLQDRLDEDATDEVEGWVERGGILVVADPASSLFRSGGEAGCPVAVDGVAVLDLGPGSGERERGADCFGRGVTTTELGLGTLVSVADRQIFTNALLGEADNAVLAAALLVPTGTERVAFVAGSAGSGEASLGDLLGRRVAQAIAELAVAFLLYALWRARRLGRAVVEPQPVAIAGSELVAAVGRLQEGRHRPDEVVETVRSDLLRTIERRLGIAAGTELPRLAEALAARCGMPTEQVLAALQRRSVASDADLLDILADLDRIRAGVVSPGGPAPRSSTSSAPPGGT
jgi:hypothetical protein